MAQTARDVLAWHHPVTVESLRAALPARIEPDLDGEGRSWVTVLAMRMADVHPRALPPVPPLSHYPQVAVRAFTRSGDHAGVTFLKLLAPGRIVTWSGRIVLGLPADRARVDVRAGEVGTPLLTATWAAGDHSVDDDFLAERDVLLTQRWGVVRRRPVVHPAVEFRPATVEGSCAALLDAVGLEQAGDAVARTCASLPSRVWTATRARS